MAHRVWVAVEEYPERKVRAPLERNRGPDPDDRGDPNGIATAKHSVPGGRIGIIARIFDLERGVKN